MGLMVPLVVTKESAILVDDTWPILLMKAAGVNVPMGISFVDAERIAAFLKDGTLEPGSFVNIIKYLLAECGTSVTKVAITEISDNEFISQIFLREGDGGEEVALPALPGEAILLALILGAPMFIDEQVVIEATAGEYAQGLISALEQTDPSVLES